MFDFTHMNSLYKSASRLAIYILVGISLVNCDSNLPNTTILIKEEQAGNVLSVGDQAIPPAVLPSDTNGIDTDLTEYKVEKRGSSCTKQRRKRRNRPHTEKEKQTLQGFLGTNFSEQKENLSELVNSDDSGKSKNLQQRSKKSDQKTNYKKGKTKPIYSLLSDLAPIETPFGMDPLEQLKNRWEEIFSNINSCEMYNKNKHIIYDMFFWKDKVSELINKNNNNDKLYAINVFSHLYPYVESVIKADFFDALLEEERLILVHLFYKLNLGIAVAHLSLLVDNSSTFNEDLILQHINGYKDAKTRLKVKFSVSTKQLGLNYLSALSIIYDAMKNSSPQTHNLFYPQQKNLYQQKVKPSLRMVEAKRKSGNNELQRINKNIPATIADDTYKFLEEELNFVKELDQKNIFTCCKELCNRYSHLEKLALRMVISEEASFERPDRGISNFTARDWANLYVGMQECIPKINMYGFIRNGVTIYINANQFDKAYLRLKAMEYFYTDKLNMLPEEFGKDFEIFQALTYTLYGEYDKLSQLYRLQIKKKLDEISKKLLYRNKLAERHRHKVEQIKSIQKAIIDTGSTSSTFAKTVQEKQAVNIDTLTNDPVSEAAYREQQQRQKQEAEDRIKRHQKADNERKQKKVLDEPLAEEKEKLSISQTQELEVRPTGVAMPESSVSLHFFLARKSYNTVSKILNNNWNINRPEVENLFRELGQTVNETTKSSHHIIKLHQAIMLVDQNAEILGIVTGLSASGNGHLSLPDWGEVIPPYMRPQILNLLRLIGVNQGNYSKANAEERTQCIPVQDNSSILQANSHSKPVANKKKSRKSKKGDTSQ